MEENNLENKKPEEPTIDYTQRIHKEIEPPLWNFLDSELLFTVNDRPNTDILKKHLLREGKIHPDDFLKIVRKAKALFKLENNLLELQDPITVCGDVHGQYFDLVKLFSIGGEPGDYVDRGFFGTECVLLLFSYKILFPNKFFMIRGNHECRHLSSYFNFKEECLFKYSVTIYDEIMLAFDCLPLGALLNGRFFCVHGGISPNLHTIEEINIIRRFREPPSSGLYCDLLWADPMEEEEERKNSNKLYVHNNLRGCSFCYSYKAVKNFLKNNNLLSIIRAHEAQDEGYKLYKKSLVTGFPTVICIFSAPNYCDVYHNKGAIIRFKNNLMNIRQFNDSPHPYYLPHFMNAFNWSLPFVIEKTLDLFKVFLNLMISEDKIENETDQKKLIINRERAKKIKKKIQAMARVRRMYKTLTNERENIVQLKGLVGGQLPKGVLSKGADGIKTAITSFSDAKERDTINEKRPPLRTELHKKKNLERKLSREDINKELGKIKKVRKKDKIKEKEKPKINIY